jgi:hypothetical protein
MRVARRILEIDNHGIPSIARIYLKVRGSLQHLVRTDIAPPRSAKERALLLNDELDDASLARLRDGGESNDDRACDREMVFVHQHFLLILNELAAFNGRLVDGWPPHMVGERAWTALDEYR